MSEFKVDIQAMAALVESLNSFEEKMKEYGLFIIEGVVGV